MIRKLSMLCVAVLLGSRWATAQTQPPPGAGAPLTREQRIQAIENFLKAAQAAKAAGRTAEPSQYLEQAQRLLQGVIEENQRDVPALALGGDVALEQMDPNAARTLYKAALEIDPGNFRANLGMGRYYVSARWWRQAVDFLDKALRVAPSDRRGEILRLMAMSYNGQGSKAESIKCAEGAVEASPEDLDGLQLLVQVYGENAQPERAVETAAKLVAAASKQRAARLSDPSVLGQLIQAYGAQHEALKQYHNTLYRRDAQDRPTDQVMPGKEAQAAQVLSQIAHIAEEISKLRWELNYHDMIMLMARAVEYQPKSTGHLLDLASLFLVTHQTERAIQTYQRLLEIPDPSDPDRAAAERNRQTARDQLQKLNAPLTTQPAAAPTTAPAP